MVEGTVFKFANDRRAFRDMAGLIAADVNAVVPSAHLFPSSQTTRGGGGGRGDGGDVAIGGSCASHETLHTRPKTTARSAPAPADPTQGVVLAVRKRNSDIEKVCCCSLMLRGMMTRLLVRGVVSVLSLGGVVAQSFFVENVHLIWSRSACVSAARMAQACAKSHHAFLTCSLPRCR